MVSVGDLIETSWNVKISGIEKFANDSIDLIETSWNVKTGEERIL